MCLFQQVPMAKYSFPSIPDEIMNGIPDTKELVNHVKIANFNALGIQLGIKKQIRVNLKSAEDLFDEWLAGTLPHEKTRSVLITALENMGQVALVQTYMEYLTTLVSLKN